MVFVKASEMKFYSYNRVSFIQKSDQKIGVLMTK